MEINVSGYRTIQSNGKNFTIFTIETTVSSRSYTVEKRYSDLLLFHKKLKKQLSTPSFPPKVLRNKDSKVLEARRIGLFNYFQGLTFRNVYTKSMLEFLGIYHIPSSMQSSLITSRDSMSEDEYNSSCDANEVFQPTHCPIIQFEGNPLFPDASKYSAPSNIVSGVFKALYA